MPYYPYKPLDPANMASRLPEPLRKPGGMALQVLMNLFGADDPNAAMPAPPVMGMASQGLRLVKGASTPIAEMLGAEWSHPSADRGARLLEALRPKDLSQVIPSMPSRVPAAPRASSDVGKALKGYGLGIMDLLKTNAPSDPALPPKMGRASEAFSNYKDVIAGLMGRR